MSASVVVVRYNAGNVRSVAHALERLGAHFSISDDAAEIMAAERVIFPGVGEAGSAMRYLRERNLDRVLKEVQRPFLSICLGLQLMAEESEENNTPCLGIISGSVKRFTVPRKVPHMGWSAVSHSGHALFEGIPQDSYFYFVHSYRLGVMPYTIGTCNYEEDFSAAVAYKNFVGVQFHPEKSADVGERLLSNFLKWSV